ncbi:MAG TPA: TolC family protein [Cyclobacteriaceae bacterium]|nr:TolC family protein [Cyclobacteriaceae bacterium]
MNRKYFFLSLAFLVLSSTIKAQNSDVASISLQEAVDIAVENNLTLKRSEVNQINNEAALLEARGQRFPSLSASASGRYNWGRSINPVTNLFEVRRIGNINISANSNVPIFAGNQINNSVQQAKVNVEVGQYNIAATRNDIILNVINLFVNVVFAKEQVNVAESQLRTATDQLTRTSSLVEAGSLPLAEKLDMEAQRATAELELINASNNLRLAKLNLSQQLLIPFNEEFDVSVPDLEAEDYPLESINANGIFSVAVETMPEVKAAELSIESAEYGVKIAKGAFYPSLGLGANLFSNYVDQATFGDRESFNTQISNNLSQALGLNLNIPVFSNFRNKASLQRARVQRNLSEIQSLEVKNQLRQDIETSYTNAYAARQSYQASLIRVASLEEAFRMAQQRFNLGALNSVDFQVAQNNLFSAQADLLNAKYEYIFRVKVLDFYLGKPITL